MKYIVLIIDGAAGLPIPDRGGRTSLELARTPHLDALTARGALGLAQTVPPGMEPSSACACMSVMGYDPVIYYKGRASIEAKSLGIDVAPDEAVFRCNLVNVSDGKMNDYSAGHITTAEATEIIKELNQELGGPGVKFYPGVGFRHILKIKGRPEILQAVCTPPHDIPGKTAADFMPAGPGSDFLRDLMARSETVLRSSQINRARLERGNLTASTIWLFWGSGQVPAMPPFQKAYGLRAALTSGVDLLRGLAMMADMDILDIKGVTDGPESDHAAQAAGALSSLNTHDLVVVHVEAPDEAGHGGHIDEKIKAIEDVDRDIIGRLRGFSGDLRVLIMPDHPTPLVARTHTADPVPFLRWGKGISANGAARFTEAEARRTGVFMREGYKIMGALAGK
ncbi:MAG: cofactor-independent phosphoglycerate mutase [Dehalococcoidales bacterium]|jgi:2,3-bisphosphoglycerate-independent phosphoglycerate mutase